MIHRLEHGKNDLKTGACDHASRGQPVGLDQNRNISTRSIASILHTHPYAVDMLRVAWFVNMRKHLVSVAPLEFQNPEERNAPLGIGGEHAQLYLGIMSWPSFARDPEEWSRHTGRDVAIMLPRL
jgi:hypothetical protein